MRESPDGLDIVDGFVRYSVDETMTARFRRVAGGDPSTVMPALLKASGLPPAPHRMRGE